MERTYLDHAATTPLDAEVAEAMASALREGWGNASSIHAEGRAARARLDRARDDVAAAIGARAREIVFTGGGSEADNLALRGVLAAGGHPGVAISAIEHHAVLDTATDLARAGARLHVLPVDRYGVVDPADVSRALDEGVSLVSVMHANNEIGTIEPIGEIGALCRARGVPFHTDAVQSVGHLPFDVRALPVDLASISGHKLGGPVGFGALYVREGVRILPVQTGGGQERGLRPGTEAVAAAVGFALALRLTRARREREAARLVALRERLVAGVLARVPDALLTGHPAERLPGHASFVVRGAPGGSLVMALDLEGFAVSSGSACAAGLAEPSHVLLAAGFDRAAAACSLRVTLGPGTTADAVDAFLAVLPRAVGRVRSAGTMRV